VSETERESRGEKQNDTARASTRVPDSRPESERMSAVDTARARETETKISKNGEVTERDGLIDVAFVTS